MERAWGYAMSNPVCPDCGDPQEATTLTCFGCGAWIDPEAADEQGQIPPVVGGDDGIAK